MRGDNVAQRKHQKIARESVARGHVLASHGTYHMQLPLLTDQKVLAEVTQAENIFERVLGVRPWLIRPPGGAHSERIDRLLAKRGYTTVLWNLGAGDFQVRSAEEVHETWRAVLERREAQGERGGIILLHDTYTWSVDAFQLIVDDLLARNCRLLQHPSEELYDFADDPALFFEPRGSGSPSEVAKAVVLDEATLAWRQARVRADTAQRCAARPPVPAVRPKSAR
jgi:peptidoglycan/xylan/chitin deacetylase (PgdA/CDA1 family)